VILSGFIGLPVHPLTIEPNDEELLTKKIVLYRIKPEKRGGEAFKLVYLVPAPIEVFWRFKTDFKGDFLVSNRYITEHRFILETGNVIITENSYSNAPNDTFRWRTMIHPGQYRLDFRLINPQECGHSFHYGSIQLKSFGTFTKVTHISYFDFFGASLWVNLPFRGGMKAFLLYTARWEDETISRLHERFVTQESDSD
jgi:hypothetical protein